MPSLTDHPSTEIVRLLNLGESGAGKTGALASLAQAGYRLWILDYDNGLDILSNLLRGDKEAVARVQYETLRDEVYFQKGVPKVKAPPSAYRRAGEVLEGWEADKFTPNDIIVLDTLKGMSDAAFNHWLFMASRLNQRPQQSDYGAMADSVLTFIDGITANGMNCNCIVNTHVRFFGGDDDTQTSPRGLPNAKGQQIPKDVGKYFNTCVLTRSKGQGPGTKRIISTQPQGVVEVKTSNPIGVKSEYPIDTGLRDLFYDILGHGPAEASKRKTQEPKNG